MASYLPSLLKLRARLQNKQTAGTLNFVRFLLINTLNKLGCNSVNVSKTCDQIFYRDDYNEVMNNVDKDEVIQYTVCL